MGFDPEDIFNPNSGNPIERDHRPRGTRVKRVNPLDFAKKVLSEVVSKVPKVPNRPRRHVFPV